MADLFQEYDSIVKQAEQPAQLPSSLYSSADASPDAEATLHRLSKKTGIPLEGLRNDNGAEAKRIAAVRSAENLHVTSPATTEFLSDPENAKLAHDDIDSLAAIEKLAREGFGKPASVMGIASASDKQAAKRAKSIGSAFVEGLVTSPERVNQAMSTVPVWAADIVNWSLEAFPDETGMRKLFADRLRESPEFWKREAEAKMQKFDPQTAENYVQQAGSSIGTSLLAAPFGMAGQNAALAMFGLFADGGYQEMRDKGVAVPTAAALSISSSAMEGLTEKIGLDRIYKGTGPILKKAIGFVMGDLAGEEINTLYNALSDKVTIKPDMTMGDVVQQVIDTAVVTAIAGPVQGVTMSGASKVSQGLYSNMQARQQAQDQADFLNALGDGVKASKTFARLPEKVQELVRAAKTDGPVTDVFVPVERFTELFQSQGMDPRQIAEQVLSDPTRYYEAVASGSDIAIPLEEFATLAGESYYQELVKDTKTSVDGISMREAEAFGQDQEKLVNDLLAQAAEEAPATEDVAYQSAFQQIYDDTYGQLVGVGRNPGQAEAEATIRAKGLATLAQRYGYDPAALLQQFPITVTRGDLPAALQRQPSFTEQQQAAKLAAMDIDKGIKFKKKMLRKDGMSLDKARELAVERGYLSEGTTTDDLLQAIDEEMRGRPKYSPEFTNHQLVDQKQSYDELAQWLDMMGVDLAQTDNSRIMEMMQQSVNAGGTELNQTGRPEWVDLANSAANKEELTAGLKKYFGVTRNPLEAGYVLPDGSLLDMSGRHYSQDHPSLRNQRSVDHRELFGENNDGFSIEELLPDLSGSDAMAYIMAVTGAMRIDIAAGVASSIGIPTQKQITMLGNALKGEFSAISLINKNTGKIIDEAEIDNTNPLKIKKFYEQAESKPDTYTYFQSLPEKITIDGVERWTVNSKGQPLAQTEEGIKNFWKWFGQSKVVDADGKPLVVYHGTDAKFDIFESGKKTARAVMFDVREEESQGFFFSPDEADAEGYGRNVMPVYLSIENPMVDPSALPLSSRSSESEKAKVESVWGDMEYILTPLIYKNEIDGRRVIDVNSGISSIDVDPDGNWVAEALRGGYAEWDWLDNANVVSRMTERGYDGAAVVEPNDQSGLSWFVLNPTQIKSVFNSGQFDPSNPNILFQSAFHGSPYTFDKFSISAIGSGEGAQAYGHGLYFAGAKEVAEWYKEKLSQDAKGKDPVLKELGNKLHDALMEEDMLGFDTYREARQAIMHHKDWTDRWEVSPESAALITNLIEAYESRLDEVGKGRLYHVELAPQDDEYLLWDKPLSEQSEKVKEALGNLDMLGKGYRRNGALIQDLKGAILYKGIAATRGEQLAEKSGGAIRPEPDDKWASEYLHSLGIRGIKYLDGTSRGKGEGNFNYVIFSEDDVAITKMEQQKRGYIKYGDSLPGFEIALLKDADSSTFIHELGHYYHEILGRLASQENAPEQLKADYQTLLNWLGATDKQSVTVEQNEKFARGFEAYLFEGNAPSQELRGVFQRFKTWLKSVYASLKSLNVQLTDDVRGVFDRLLATDEEIQAAEKEQGAKPIFATAEEAGMSPAVFEAYRKLAEQAHEDAKDRLERTKLKEVKRVQERWWKDEREKMAAEVEAEAKQNPVYEVLNFLYTGKLFDGSAFEGQEFKLSKADLMQMYDDATIKALQKKLGWIYRKEGGLSPHVAAEMFGFSSADEMIQRIMEAPKLKEYVQAETDRRMTKQYGEMNTAEIADAAINAVHNDEQAKLLREELKAINRKVKEVRPFLNAEKRADREARKEAFDSVPPVEFFREAAKRAIAAKKVSDLMPGVYSRAEQKAGRQAIELNGKGRYAEAAEAKQKQILNHYLYREALQAREDADKIASYMRGLGEGKAQQRIGKAGQDYLEQVNAILDRYEFRRQTGAVLAERERLVDWMARKERETGLVPPIPPGVLREAQQVNYRTLTVAELRDIDDAVKAITHMARVEGKLLKDQEKQDIMDLADEAAASIEDNSKGVIPRKPEKNLPQDRPGALMENYFASHRKMSSLARQMDGGKDGGAIWNLIIRPLNQAGDKEAVMRAEASEKLSAIFGVYSALERTKMHRREFIPEVNQSISKWGRIVVALNMGNEGNRQRLSVDFTPDEVAAIVEPLDERDWKFVQSVWDMINEYWPLIEDKEKRVYGVAPSKVVAMPVDTKYGTLPGGYYPIKYDAGETAKTGAQEEAEIYKQMMGGAFTKATTRHGHTELRLEAVNRPLSLSIDTLFQHVNQVIHDLTHHEMLIDVNKLLGTTQIQNAIRDNYGMEAYKVFTDGIRDVAVGDIPAQNAFEKFMAYSRVGISTAGLGYNMVTSMMQPLGLTQSIVRIGPRWVGKGISRWISSPKHMIETAEWIYDKSEFMRLRGKTQNREIAEIRNQMTVGVIPHAVRDSFFYFIQQMQKTVDIPTWLGQYEKSMAEHGNEADAIAEADQAVIDSQASGMTKDLARIQRGGPLQKLFTTFYSFFSTTYNLAAESKGRTNFKDPSEIGRFMVDMLMLYTVPVVMVTALKEAVQRGIGGGDDDEEKLLKKLAGEQLGYIMGGFVGLRELSSLFSGFQGYEGPAGARVYSESAKLAKEIGQGEWDAGLYKRLNSLGGILLHYPATQVQRTTEGIIELYEGRGNLLSLFFGKPKK